MRDLENINFQRDILCIMHIGGSSTIVQLLLKFQQIQKFRTQNLDILLTEDELMPDEVLDIDFGALCE